MKILKREVKKCLKCEIKHEVKTVEILDRKLHNDTIVAYQAVYDYCENLKAFVENEDKISYNHLSMLLSYDSIIEMNS